MAFRCFLAAKVAREPPTEKSDRKPKVLLRVLGEMVKNLSCFSAAASDDAATCEDCDVTTSSEGEEIGGEFVVRSAEDLKMYEEFFQELTDNPVSFVLICVLSINIYYIY